MSTEADRPSEDSVGAVVLAVTTLDCARRLRVRYRLPVVVDATVLAVIGAGLVLEIQPFSRFVAGARDHAILTGATHTRVTTVIGERMLVATFARRDDDHDRDRDDHDDDDDNDHDASDAARRCAAFEARIASIGAFTFDRRSALDEREPTTAGPVRRRGGSAARE